jgi:hypothetical protein
MLRSGNRTNFGDSKELIRKVEIEASQMAAGTVAGVRFEVRGDLARRRPRARRLRRLRHEPGQRHPAGVQRSARHPHVCGPAASSFAELSARTLQHSSVSTQASHG